MKGYYFVYIHGWLGSPDDWGELTADIKHKLLITIPGHNHTQALNTENGFDTIIDSIKKIILIGYSLGGRIALAFAKRNPDIIKHLILISTHPGTNNKHLKNKQIAQETLASNKLNTLTLNQFLDDWYSQALFSPLSTSLKENLIQKRLQNNANNLRESLAHFSHRFYEEHDSFLETIASKTLYIVGEEDKKYFAFAKHLNALNISTATVTNGGHALLETHPKELSNLIHSFLHKKATI